MSYGRIIQTAPTNLQRGSEVQPWTTRIPKQCIWPTAPRCHPAKAELAQRRVDPHPVTMEPIPEGTVLENGPEKTREWCGFKWFKSHCKSLVSNRQHPEIEISYPRNGQNRPKDTSIRRKVCSNAQTIHDLQLLRCKHPSESQIMSTNLRKHLSKKSTNKEAASSNNTSCTSWVSALHSETAKHNPWHVAWRDHPVAIPRTSCRHDLSNSHGYPEYQRRCDCNDPWTMVNWIRSLNPRCVAPKCLILPNGWQWEKGSYCKIIAQKAFQWVRH